MVSGLVTSPCDHCRIFSGDASEIRIASKSGASCVFSCWNRNTCFLHCQLPIASCRLAPGETDPFDLSKLRYEGCRLLRTNWQLEIGNRQCLRFNSTGDDRFTNTVFSTVAD